MPAARRRGRLARSRSATDVTPIGLQTKQDTNMSSNERVPKPAHPRHRARPLPWQSSKPSHEDPDAPKRVQALLESPSYRLADADVAFLNLPETRGVRLQLDYWKPELLLEQHRIGQTIVVFGSTRIPEPRAARHRIDDLLRRQAGASDDEHLAREIAIAERVLAKSSYYEISREFGRLVGTAGRGAVGGDLVVMTGGGPGIMEAANRGAYDAGAKTVGLNIDLPHEQFPNPYITPELCFRFHYFALRKLHFLMRAKALVAFPGGYGTFDELFETLALIQTRKIKPVPVVLVGERYWRQAFNVDFLVDEGVIEDEDRELFWFAEAAQEIWDSILHWYRLSGEPLIPEG
jgi:uncharacterized protein (TIGR00730 family)